MRVEIMLPMISAAYLFITSIAAGAYVDENFSPDQLQLNLVPLKSKNENRYTRIKRQFTTTTPRPKKKRPSNIFSLISELIAETRDDTNRAFSEIGVLLNSQFKEPQKPGSVSTTTTTTPPPSTGDDADNEITTTTEPYKITRQEFMGIIRSNFQGIVRLFGKEFRVALRDSGKNVLQFGKEFRESLRPYVT